MSQQWMPHGFCFRWHPDILWPTLIGDWLMFGSFSAIGLVLAVLVVAPRWCSRVMLRAGWPRVVVDAYRDRAGPLLWLFAAFIFGCGVTHALGAMSIYDPGVYRPRASTNLMVGLVALATALVVVYLALRTWIRSRRGPRV